MQLSELALVCLYISSTDSSDKSSYTTTGRRVPFRGVDSTEPAEIPQTQEEKKKVQILVIREISAIIPQHLIRSLT